PFSSFLFSNHPPPPATYPLSLHDALPICLRRDRRPDGALRHPPERDVLAARADRLGQRAQVVRDEHHDGIRGRLLEVLEERVGRSEEHTSELQSPYDLVCRLLLEKKKKKA